MPSSAVPGRQLVRMFSGKASGETEGSDHHGRSGDQGDCVGDHEGDNPGRRAVDDPQDESHEQNREVTNGHVSRGPLTYHAADLQHGCDAHQYGPRRCGNCENGLCHGVPPVRRPGCWIVFASYLVRGASTTMDMLSPPSGQAWTTAPSFFRSTGPVTPSRPDARGFPDTRGLRRDSDG